jgi:hypothetical protein
VQNNQPAQGILNEHATCHEAVTRGHVRERAVELAAMNGRSPLYTTKADWDQARRELTGEPAAEPAKPAAARCSYYESFSPKNCMSKNNSVVAIYQTHTDAEMAVRELQQAGFDMKKLSIVGRGQHTDEHVIGYYNGGDRMKAWGKTGAFWGGLWGLLFGSAFFMIPGLGPLLVAGPLASMIVGALEGAAVVGGLSVLGAGLVGMGIPDNSILEYETALKTDKFLLIAHGSSGEIAHAKDILGNTNLESLAHHQ